MRRGGWEQLLRSLAVDQNDSQTAVTSPDAVSLADANNQVESVRPADPADDDQLEQPPIVESGSEVAAAQSGAPKGTPRPLTEPELQLLAAIEPLIETPREAKRLLNLYRLLRSTRDLSIASRFLGEDGSPGEFQAVIVLLGLLTAHARLLGQVLDTQPNEDPLVLGGLSHRPDSDSWDDFVKGFHPKKVDRGWRNDIVGTIRDEEVAEWHRLGLGIEQASRLGGWCSLTSCGSSAR
jgi:hypothetical protein